jgi:hypothetical protein
VALAAERPAPVVLGRACRCWRPPLRCCADPHRGPQWWTPVMLKLLDIHSCCTRWTSSSSCAVAAVALGQSYAFAGPRLSSLPQHSVRATLHRTPLCCHALADSRTRRYCRHSLFHSLGPALLLLLDPACRHSTGPSVRHSSLDPQFVLRSPGPQFIIALLDPRQCSAHTGPSWQSHAILHTSLLCHSVGMSGQ